MHISGKIAAFLVVVAALAASLLTSKLVLVRNSWTAKTMTSKTKFADLQPKIETLENQITALRNELFRSREMWGLFWNRVPTNVTNQADGTLQIDIGINNGVRDGLLMHGYEMAADGSTIYRGSFLASQAGNANTTLKPNWRATPDEVRTWQPGEWRWRNLLPSGYQENFDKQLLTILKHEETLGDRLRTLESQKSRLTDANANLKLRESELVGGAGLAKSPNVDPENRNGLVAVVEQIEEERNRSLQQIDELRRKVRKVQADIQSLQTENVELVNKLPKAAPRDQVTQKR